MVKRSQISKFSMEHGGKTYTGYYYVEDNIVTVFTRLGVETSTLTLGNPAEPLARVLLKQMIVAGRFDSNALSAKPI